MTLDVPPTLGRDTRVLVTGATGFIGRHLLARLRGIGCTVHAATRHPDAELPDGVRRHVAELADAEAAARVVSAARPDVIVHLGGLVTGTREPDAVLPTLHANLLASVHLLDAAHRSGARLVMTGSVEENAPGPATSPYAAAKRAAAEYAGMYHRLWGVRATVLRLSMVYGPGPQEPRRLLPHVIDSALRGRAPRLSSGVRLVDWVYVDDVVDAVLKAACADAAGAVLDIASGAPVSVRATVERVLGLMGSAVRPDFGALPDRPFDAPQLADIAPAFEVLGWQPSVTLDDGLRRTVRWQAEHGGGPSHPRADTPPGTGGREPGRGKKATHPTGER